MFCTCKNRKCCSLLDINYVNNQKKLRHQTEASTLDAQESTTGTATSVNVTSPSNLTHRPGTAEVATSSTVQSEDDIVVIDSNSSKIFYRIDFR